MKKLLIVLAVFLTSCADTAIEQLNKVDKPCVVYSKVSAKNWFDDDQLTLKDRTGKLIEIDGFHRKQLCDKFNVGDTIK